MKKFNLRFRQMMFQFPYGTRCGKWNNGMDINAAYPPEGYVLHWGATDATTNAIVIQLEWKDIKPVRLVRK